MGYIGKVPADVLIDPMVDSAAITDATIVTADLANDAVTSAKLAADSVDSSELVNGSVDNAHLAGSIAMNKTNLTAGTGLTLSTDTLSVDAAQTQITSVGTIGTGVWNGTAIASAYLDADTAHLSGSTFTGTVSLGDLDIIPTSSNVSVIKHDSGSGSLTIQGDQVNIKNRAGDASGLQYNDGGGVTFPNNVIIGGENATPEVELFYNHSNGSDYKSYLKLAGNDLEVRGSSGTMEFYTGAVDGDSSTLALSIDSSQDATFAGKVTIENDAAEHLTLKRDSSHWWDMQVGSNGNLNIQKNSATDNLIIASTGHATLAVPSGSTGWGLTITNSYSGSSDVQISMAYANSSNRNSGIGVSMDDTDSGEYLLNLASGGSDQFRVRGNGLVQCLRGFTNGQALDIEGETFGRTNSSNVAFGYRQDGNGQLMKIQKSTSDVFIMTNSGRIAQNISEASAYSATFENTSSGGHGLRVYGGASSADYLIRGHDHNGNDRFAVRSNGEIQGVYGGSHRLTGNWRVLDVVSEDSNDQSTMSSNNCFNDQTYSHFKIIIPWIGVETDGADILCSFLYNTGSGLTEATNGYYGHKQTAAHSSSSYQGGAYSNATRMTIFNNTWNDDSGGIHGEVLVYNVTTADMRNFSGTTYTAHDHTGDGDRGSNFRPFATFNIIGYDTTNGYGAQSGSFRQNDDSHASYWKGIRFSCNSGNFSTGSKFIVMGMQL